jgi:tetratricopeptide (TPR) repeat protein
MVLRELEHASLVQQHVPGRYRMHDLIRLYATDTAHHDLTEEVRNAALRRVLDFYIHTVHAASSLLRTHRTPIRLDPPALGVLPQPLPDVPAALAWLDIEYPVLLAAQHAAAGHAWQATVWQLAWALDTFQARRGHRHDRLAGWRAALDAAAHLPDPTPRILAHRLLGYSYATLGRFEEGIGHLHQALALATEHHDPDQQACTHQTLARVWEQRGDDRHALKHATHALDLCRTLDQPVGMASALNQVGWYAAQLGQFDTARSHCQAALTLYQHHEPDGEAATLDSLGYIAHHTGEHQQAIDYYRQALTVYRVRGNSFEVANTLDGLGHPHVALGEHAPARVVWREALELYQLQGRDDDVAGVERQLDDLDQRAGTAGPHQ